MHTRTITKISVVAGILFLATIILVRPLWRPAVSYAQGPVEWAEGTPPPTGDLVSAFAVDPSKPTRA